MRSHARLGVYLLVALALLGVLVASPRVWALAPLAPHGQTVPTRTPTRPYAPTRTPTQAPPPNTPVPPTELPPATGEPVLPAPSPESPAGQPMLALTKSAGRLEAWPGATVVYTLTLRNTGTISARRLALEDTLPPGLEPAELLVGQAAWDGRAWRAQAALLPPGGSLSYVYSAVVSRDLPYGSIVTNMAVATAAGGLRAVADALIALPPAELPPTGASRVSRAR